MVAPVEIVALFELEGAIVVEVAVKIGSVGVG